MLVSLLCEAEPLRPVTSVFCWEALSSHMAQENKAFKAKTEGIIGQH